MKQHSAFWRTKSLEELNEEEWESLCDGCGKCCLIKLQDEETDEIFTTAVACELLNINTCRCSDYANRKARVPECLKLRPMTKDIANLLPDTCAYRLLFYGQALPDWHPLISNNKESTRTAGISIAGKVISAKHIHPDELEKHIID